MLKSIINLLFQFSLLVFSYVIFNAYDLEEIKISPFLITLICLWIVSMWLSHKHKPKYYQRKLKYVLSPFYRAYLFLFITSSLVYLLFFNTSLSYETLLYTLLPYFLIEITIYVICILIYRANNKFEIASPKEIKKFEQTFLEIKDDVGDITKEKLSEIVPEIKETNLSEILSACKEFDKQKESILVTENSNIEEQADLFHLTVRLNDCRRINKTILEIVPKIKNGGYIIVKYKELDKYENELKKVTPKLLLPFRILWYYLFQRALLKIPKLNQIYFTITKGKNRVISKTEVWGRLTYCGFDVLHEIEDNDNNYIIAQKVKTISENPSPSFIPIIQLNRVGLYGNIIKVSKVRSMYPFSEFIQQKIFEMNQLNSTGKINNDFRITKIGKFCRKFWLDELPQFLDWFRGEIKLVGIRAMSQHYFSLYSKEYQNLFYQVKPGFFSPIFDEGTDSFEDIQRIEQEYLESYLKNPTKTDIQYFLKTITHILKGVRSK
jgi:lipopolysaccharide/colanic/teichoic acid biosynthesis glycosyltransferase